MRNGKFSSFLKIQHFQIFAVVKEIFNFFLRTPDFRNSIPLRKSSFLDKFWIVIIFENSIFLKFSEFPDDRSYGSWKGLFSEKSFSEQVRIEISEISMFPGVRTGYLENCQ